MSVSADMLSEETRKRLYKNIHVYYMPLTIITGLFTFLPLLGLIGVMYKTFILKDTDPWIFGVIATGTILFCSLLCLIFIKPFLVVYNIKNNNFDCRYLYVNRVERKNCLSLDKMTTGSHHRIAKKVTSYYDVFYWDGQEVRIPEMLEKTCPGMPMYVLKIKNEFYMVKPSNT